MGHYRAMHVDAPNAVALIDAILADWRAALGAEYRAYRNHAQRVARFCQALHGGSADDGEKIAVAAAFHDLGIWTDRTMDYLGPSVGLARGYLSTRGLGAWADDIGAMISNHHKLTMLPGGPHGLAEAFRRADLIDLSLGLFRFGLDAAHYRTATDAFPNAGFHRAVGRRLAHWALSHPLRPAPMMKW
jgi:hypothetical protein